ncbi:MAG: winged helix-turn-helix transcriptional regulator, partial [Euryarchaeota archaeon]|nr:winged helix-turn-helix transcriptional regulator [Euryarchaeota archaeon]
DLEIIEQLKLDGRQSFRRIAKKLGLSTATVSLRFSKMERAGIIKKVVPVIDYKKLGKSIPTIVSLRIEASKLDSVVGSLKKLEGVEDVSLVDGSTTSNLERFLKIWTNSAISSRKKYRECKE